MITRRTESGVDGIAVAHATEICIYLDWDSEFFGKRIARLNRSRLEASSTSEALVWCADNRIDCLYFLADPDDSETRRLADQNSFFEVDMRLTLARPMTQQNERSQLSADSRVRLARESDLPQLRRLARTLHHDSRFYFDQQFERSKCDSAVRNLDREMLRGSGANRICTRSGWPSGRLHNVRLKRPGNPNRTAGSGRDACPRRTRQSAGAEIPLMVCPAGSSASNRRNSGPQHGRPESLSKLWIPAGNHSALVPSLVHEPIVVTTRRDHRCL